MDEEYVITWEAPIIEKPEFRLYYDDRGNVVTYTCEKIDGDYVVIDALTFAEARPDVSVVNGKLIRQGSGIVISKLKPSEDGRLCEREDVSILSESGSDGQYWKLVTINIE